MCHNLSIYSPVNDDLGCFQFLEIVNKAFTNIHLQVFMCVCVGTYGFIFLGYISRTGVAGSYAKHTFNFIRN